METKREFIQRVIEEKKIRQAYLTLQAAVKIKEMKKDSSSAKYTRKLQDVGVFINCVR